MHRVGFYSNVDAAFLPVGVGGGIVSLYAERGYPADPRPTCTELEASTRAIIVELQEWGPAPAGPTAEPPDGGPPEPSPPTPAGPAIFTGPDAGPPEPPDGGPPEPGVPPPAGPDGAGIGGLAENPWILYWFISVKAPMLLDVIDLHFSRRLESLQSIQGR
jgi:hypothetical protein